MRVTITAIVAVVLLWAAPTRATVVFKFSSDPGTSPDAIGGFAAAGAMWSALFTDNVTVNIHIAFTDTLPPQTLGSTSYANTSASYTAVRDALTADRITVHDTTAVSFLQPGAALNLVLNRTSNNPNGAGSATSYLDSDGDANNTTIRLTTANAKALRLWPATDPAADADIQFNSTFNWDFNRADGVTGYDFVGIAVHEIGHALGFVSGVDILDNNSPPVAGPFRDDQFTYVSPADLFRFSTTSTNFGIGVIDWSADTRDKYFSIDGGTTKLAGFSTGGNFGDGRQASHWLDNLGIMDPTAAQGELLSISTHDTRLLDVIGWDPFTLATIPEPSTTALGLVGLLLVLRTTRRQLD